MFFFSIFCMECTRYFGLANKRKAHAPLHSQISHSFNSIGTLWWIFVVVCEICSISISSANTHYSNHEKVEIDLCAVVVRCEFAIKNISMWVRLSAHMYVPCTYIFHCALNEHESLLLIFSVFTPSFRFFLCYIDLALITAYRRFTLWQQS